MCGYVRSVFYLCRVVFIIFCGVCLSIDGGVCGVCRVNDIGVRDVWLIIDGGVRDVCLISDSGVRVIFLVVDGMVVFICHLVDWDFELFHILFVCRVYYDGAGVTRIFVSGNLGVLFSHGGGGSFSISISLYH